MGHLIFLSLILFCFSAFSQVPDQYARQAQEERIRNEKKGIEIRKELPKEQGYKKDDPRLRDKNEPYDQAGRVMRPD